MKPMSAVALLALIVSVIAVPASSKVACRSPKPSPKPSPNTQPTTNLCGNDEHIILDGTPWLVANSMYGAAQMVGTSCTHYNRIDTPAGGNPKVVWGSQTAIQNIESTSVDPPDGDLTIHCTDLRDSNNICKGYANIGLIGNLGTTISSINSIPAAYDVSISLGSTSG